MEKREFAFGEGKISGYLSSILGALCLGAVFCFHFPEYLTTPELRAVYPVEFLRRVLAFFIALSFILGIISFILSSKKTLALWGLVFSILSVLLGGSQVTTPDQVIQKNYLGLDWFILDILIVAMIFIPIESLFYRIKQKIFRQGWKTDFYHFLFSHLLIQGTSFLILYPSIHWGAKIAQPGLQQLIQSQPLILQFVEIILVADLVQYWVHRSFHKIPFLWKFHAIHHSAEEMDWLAGSRLHLVDIVITRGLTLLPLFIFGFKAEALQAYLVFVAFWATFLHVNIRYEFKFLQKFFATPRYHHWHHGATNEALDKNFAVHLPILDQIFGSYYLPESQWPPQYGTHGEKVPDSYLKQLTYPFKNSP